MVPLRTEQIQTFRPDPALPRRRRRGRDPPRRPRRRLHLHQPHAGPLRLPPSREVRHVPVSEVRQGRPSAPLRVPQRPSVRPRAPSARPAGRCRCAPCQRAPLALVVPVEILAPALDQLLPAPDRPDQFPQRAVGAPDPESVEQAGALPVGPLPHYLLPLLQLGPLLLRPGFRTARAPASARARHSPKTVPRHATKPSCRTALRRPAMREGPQPEGAALPARELRGALRGGREGGPLLYPPGGNASWFLPFNRG